MKTPLSPFRELTIIAQDPEVRDAGGKLLLAKVKVPREDLAPGPKGARVHVVDYDASTDTMLRPAELDADGDAFADKSEKALLASPAFHAQNTYAIVMRILARFEYALGRRVGWSFGGHQLCVAPHAFIDANAFYSKRDQGLFFGYFPSAERKGQVYTCLSHDIVAHETTHALLDGLHGRYTDPSSPDQAAFHEGFSDVVALLSVFALPEVIRSQLSAHAASEARRTKSKPHPGLIAKRLLTRDALLGGPVTRLGEEMGSELHRVRGQALRESAKLPRDPKLLATEEMKEPHARGEVLVASMLDLLCEVWSRRTSTLGEILKGQVDLERVVEEGANVADRLLTIAIRALDYAPPVDLQFGDYLSALLTADRELFLDDEKYGFRELARACFAARGIEPASDHEGHGTWDPIDPTKQPLSYERNHFEPMQRDVDEVFHFVWQNRKTLVVHPDAFCRVLSVRPCMRQGPDGFVLRETVARYLEILTLRGDELRRVTLRPAKGKPGKATRLRQPEGLPDDEEVKLYGGGTLVFDEFGRLKFHVKNRIESPRQQARLESLLEAGYFDDTAATTSFANMHLRRTVPSAFTRKEAW